MNFYCSYIEKKLDFDLQTIKSPNSDWFLYLDDGWTINKDHVYKGIDSNWCRIDFGEGLRITTNKLRDFPIYYSDTCVSNFLYTCGTQLPTDGTIYWNKSKKPIVSYNTNFYPTINEKHLTFNECKNILFESLCSNIEQFAKTNTKPILIPLHGGIDTLTIRSVFDYLKIKYEFFEFKNKPKYSKIQEYLTRDENSKWSLGWGFNQIAEKDNCVIVSGFHGDEWALRNPYYVHLILSNRNISIVDEFEKTKECYMKTFFFKEKYNEKCKNKQPTDIKKLMSIIIHDFQVWHLHKTLILAPFKHINNLQLLNADNDTLIKQVTDAELSKSIIEKCNSTLLQSIDEQKNVKDPEWFWKDYQKFYN